ncbi:MAG TPA: type VI secretion system tip protein VgrG [Bacteroidia bacterium]|nr:type VI secretion system tip protein VgrG [Bacteroidia bacterium]
MPKINSTQDTIPGHKKISHPVYTVTIGGKKVSSNPGVASVMVNKGINRISVAEIVLYDGSASKQEFKLSEGNDYLPGKEVIIEATYQTQEDTSTQQIFSGIIIRQSIKANLTGPSTLLLEARDKIIKSTIERKNACYFDKKDSEIIEQLLGTYGVQKEVAATKVTHKDMVQYYSTDWDFLVSRAEANGLLVYVDDGKVTVADPEKAQATSPSLEITYGTNIVEIDAEMDARDQYAGVTSKDWDFTKQELGVNIPSTPVFKEEGTLNSLGLSDVMGSINYRLQHSGKLEEGELTAWADAKFLRSKMTKIKGRVRIYGTNVAKPGKTFTFDGLGDHFNNTAFISSVTHSFSAHSTWYTDIQFGYSDEWFYERHDNITEKSAAGLLPAMHGLQPGKITAVKDTDSGDFRVRVKYPLIESDSKGIWARWATLDAGNNRGFVNRPYEGDEVILGFVNNDPRDPVVLGMLHSSVNAIPSDLTPDDNSLNKGWVTKNNIKILLHDEADKDKVTIETPGGNMIVIDDEKKSITITNKGDTSVTNTITMDKNGIKLESDKDIIINAKGSSSKITATGSQNVALESKQGKFTAKGQTGAEMTTSGQAVLKGQLVKIN